MSQSRSPQEIRIQNEINHKKIANVHENRATEILKKVRESKPQIDIERGLYFTKSFQKTEGQPLILRWAKALKYYAENASIYIDENQLIVGRSGKPGRYGILYPELDGDTLDEAIKTLPSRDVSPFDITPEDAKIITEQITPYWKGKTFHEDLAKALPRETKKLTYNGDKELTSRYIVNETASFRSSLQWVHDYEIVLEKGFEGIKEEALERLQQLDSDSPVDQTEKRPFLEAQIITSDAIILWAERHAKLAKELSAKQRDADRKKELKIIAEICERVPRYPARTFYEALQSQWFTQMFSRIEQKTGTIISNGRMDQYLYPFYQKDIKEGRITDEQVQELFECMWVAMSEFVDLYLSEAGGSFNEGYAHWEAVTIGGTTKKGYDATNELTYILLKSKREFPLNYPDLAARIHMGSPKRYLYEVAETIKDGTGFPKLINDDEVVPILLSKGASLKEAYDYSVSGCAECRMPNRDTYTSPNAYIHFATPLGSSLHKLCRESYKDLHQPSIPGGIDLGYFEFIGYATVVDSLSAIKKLIFEEKRLTKKELLEAVNNDFKGYEAIRQLLLHAPSYGNDDSYTDEIGQLLDLEAQKFTHKYGKELGVHMDLRLVPFTSHVPFGKVIGATPNGRFSYTPLSDGSSASQGADLNGPTAVLLSNYKTKNFDYEDHAARLLNIKLSPSCVEGENGTEKLVQFIKAWHDLRLWHLQFNVLNTETLRQAQKQPQLYKNLLVRIAGYSAYFTELSKDLQDDIIARTEHEEVS